MGPRGALDERGKTGPSREKKTKCTQFTGLPAGEMNSRGQIRLGRGGNESHRG